MPERSDMALRFNNHVHRQKPPQEPKLSTSMEHSCSNQPLDALRHHPRAAS